jgi:eukaryotic-like serine/threonine-protein kinase
MLTLAGRLERGQVIHGFRLEEPLHRGGMAMLWRVAHPAHQGPLVMKVPLLAYGEGPGAIVGFEVEGMILPRLSGPHVPRFVASADFSEQPYIVMELIEGQSLLPVVDEAPLPSARVAEIGAKVAAALHDIHRQHVIHLDIKPGNVMLRVGAPAPGAAVLIDFGLSRHDELPDLLAEEFRLPVGSGPYMAPEQALGDRSDPRSDIFALGVILNVLATGVHPFGFSESVRTIRRRLWRDPTPPRALNPDCPPWLQEVILRCLSVDPAERPATAAQLAFDLQHPDQVRLTERAERLRRDGPLAVWKRRLAAIGREPKPPGRVSRQLDTAPIIMAAVDLSPDEEDLADALRVILRRILQIEPGARVASVHVLKTSRVAIDFLEDEHGRNLHVRRLVELKHWARTLQIAPERLTFTVLEAPDPAAALLDHARQLQADHIVIGARGSSAVRRYLGSVSSEVVAGALCNVTVVRARAWREGMRGGEGAREPDRALNASPPPERPLPGSPPSSGPLAP